jgi:predicted SPOUT superfamily RNA methylase MTH1
MCVFYMPYQVQLLTDLLSYATTPPYCNQVE